MATKRDTQRSELTELLSAALQKGKKAPLETYLKENSGLPGTRMNLSLVDAFANEIGAIITLPDPPVEKLEALLDGWANLTEEEAPTNDPKEILPACAVLSYGQAAVSQPEWWDAEAAKLEKAAGDPRWRLHEMVAAALQRMLASDWPRTFDTLNNWLRSENPLVIRAVAAAVAEPPLLTDTTRGMNALALQAQALGWLMRVPQDQRKEEDMRTLRKALGYTLSVAIAAAPDTGLGLLDKLAAMPDPDIRWVVRENLKKSRLKPWAAIVESVQNQITGQ